MVTCAGTSTVTRDHNTTIVVPGEFFSPLSYSLSVSSTTNKFQRQQQNIAPPPPPASQMGPNLILSQPPPPPPSAQKSPASALLRFPEYQSSNMKKGNGNTSRSREKKEKETSNNRDVDQTIDSGDWNRLLSFSHDYTPKSLLPNRNNTDNDNNNINLNDASISTKEMNKDIQDLFTFIDQMTFSPQMKPQQQQRKQQPVDGQKQMSNQYNHSSSPNNDQSSVTKNQSTSSKQFQNGLPPRSKNQQTRLNDRTNQQQQLQHQQQQYQPSPRKQKAAPVPEMPPAKKFDDQVISRNSNSSDNNDTTYKTRGRDPSVTSPQEIEERGTNEQHFASKKNEKKRTNARTTIDGGAVTNTATNTSETPWHHTIASPLRRRSSLEPEPTLLHERERSNNKLLDDSTSTLILGTAYAESQTMNDDTVITETGTYQQKQSSIISPLRKSSSSYPRQPTEYSPKIRRQKNEPMQNQKQEVKRHRQLTVDTGVSVDDNAICIEDEDETHDDYHYDDDDYTGTSTMSRRTASRRSNRVVATPDDARKLLRTAVSALQDARAERDSARKWASTMKESVTKWAEEQRKIIQSETSAQIQQQLIKVEEEQQQRKKGTDTKQVVKENEVVATGLTDLESAIRQLHIDFQNSNKDRASFDAKLHDLLLRQQDKINGLSQQLTSMEQLVSEGGTRVSPGNISSTEQRFEKRRQPFSTALVSPSRERVPEFVNKTPQHQQQGRQHHDGSSHSSSSSSRRVRRQMHDGGHIVVYGNGVRKEVHRDGTTVIRFANGDIETKFVESGTVAYFHARENVMQITTSDGSTLFEYPNKQIERHYPDGTKAIIFPDGVKQRISPNGQHVETFFS